jgi:membrane protein YqaA with SNARE-associated domain
MDFAFTAEAGLAGLFLASFLSATLLPGGSEAVLFAVIRLHPEQTLPALLLATLGNTLGGMVTYWHGPPAARQPEKLCEAALAKRRRWRDGADRPSCCWPGRRSSATPCAPPPAGCGCRRWPARLWMAAGKAARYAVVVAGAGMV